MRGVLVLLLAMALAAPAAAAPPAAAPPTETPAATRPATELNALLDALKAAPTEPAAAVLQARIAELWVRQGGPAAGLLLNRGARNLKADAADEALADFNAALTLSPNFAEAYNRRAIALFELGDYPHALLDLREALRLDPRHFSAFATLSRIAEARQNWKGALEAWQKVLEFSPNTPDGVTRLKALRIKALGEQS